MRQHKNSQTRTSLLQTLHYTLPHLHRPTTMTLSPSLHHNYHHLPALLASMTKESRVPHFSYLVDHRTLSILSVQGKMALKVNLLSFMSAHSPLKPPFLLLPLSEILTLLPLPSPNLWTLEDRPRLLRQKKRLTFWNISNHLKL